MEGKAKGINKEGEREGNENKEEKKGKWKSKWERFKNALEEGVKKAGYFSLAIFINPLILFRISNIVYLTKKKYEPAKVEIREEKIPEAPRGILSYSRVNINGKNVHILAVVHNEKYVDKNLEFIDSLIEKYCIDIVALESKRHEIIEEPPSSL